METLDFLRRLLPDAGVYISFFITPQGMPRQRYFDTLEGLAEGIKQLNDKGNNTYYAISAYKDRSSRSQKNVRTTKVFALDVDCGEGKPFASWKEGLVALGEFVQQVSLPKPMVVRSGNGLHVYWPLTTELAPQQWRPIAEALKSAAQAKGFAIDPAVPADSARVLRPVGTINPKGGRTVSLLIDAPDSDPVAIARALAPYRAMALLNVPASSKQSTSKLSAALAVTVDLPPGQSDVIASKCQQVNWAVNNQAEVSEPFWYGLLGVAAHCEDPEATAIKWSDRHPLFDQADTIRKLNHWRDSTTGPATCNKFKDERPDGCKGCPYAGKITSPTQLGVVYKEVALSDDAPSPVAQEINIPRPYKRTEAGIKITIDKVDIDVCPFDLYPVGYGRDENRGYEVVRYHWKRPHMGWQELRLRQAYLTEERIKEFSTEIADQGIVLGGKDQTGTFQRMLRSYMDELRKSRSMTNLHNSMGWKNDYRQFVLGDTVFSKCEDGSVMEERIAMSGIGRSMEGMYTLGGTLEGQKAVGDVIRRFGLVAHNFAYCVGLSAPFYAITGLKGATISLYGPTGGGKTLAQYIIQSIWGNPDPLHFAAKFTQNTLFSRMGFYSNLPVTVDEITMMDMKDMSDFAYWVSQGRDKARLNRMAEERDAKTWALPVIVSTNRSMHMTLASGQMADATPQMMRILEVVVHPHPMFSQGSEAGKRIYTAVHSNYGHVGRELIKYALKVGIDKIREEYEEHARNFCKIYKCKFSGQERYWEVVIVMADFFGRLAQRLGLITFDPSEGTEFVLSQIGAIRRAVASHKLDAYDLLIEYLNEFSNATVVASHNSPGAKPYVDTTRLPRAEVRARLDLYRPAVSANYDHGTVLLDRAYLRRWLSSRNADYRTFINEFQEDGILATPPAGRAYLARDTPIKLGQSYVVGINLNHPRLEGIIRDKDQEIEDLTLGNLKLVE